MVHIEGCNEIYKHILETDARIVVCYGGRDSGKSYFVGGQYVPHMLCGEEKFRGMAVRKVHATHRDSCYMEVLDGLETIYEEGAEKKDEQYKAIYSPMEIRHSNGNKIIFRGLDEPRKLKSLKGLNFIWVEEAEDLTQEEFSELAMLLRGEGKQQIVLTFNPVDEGHFANGTFVESVADEVKETFPNGEKKVWVKYLSAEVDGHEHRTKALCLRTTYEDNAYITIHRKAMIEQLAKTDPFLYDVYRLGKFGTRGGRILTNIEERDFAMDGLRFSEFEKRGYAQDFGFNHANCILALAERDNHLYVFEELYGSKKDTAEWIDEAEKRKLEKRLQMVCDSAEPDRIKTWVRAGYRATGAKKGAGSVGAQIDRLKRFEKIYINCECVNTLREAREWKWQQDRNGRYIDVPMNTNDDAMAAMRYGCELFPEGGTGMMSVGREMRR